MAEPESICEWLEIELDKLSAEDKINLSGEIADELTAQEIVRARTRIEEKQEAKKEDVKSKLREQIQEMLVQADLAIAMFLSLQKNHENRLTCSLACNFAEMVSVPQLQNFF